MFAGAVPPYLLKTDDNPEGGLGEEDAQGLEQGAREDREGFLDGFSTNFFTAGEELKVTEEQRQEWLTLAGAASSTSSTRKPPATPSAARRGHPG